MIAYEDGGWKQGFKGDDDSVADSRNMVDYFRMM
jgi:hypothetical protein